MLSINLNHSLVALSLLISLAALCDFAQAKKIKIPDHDEVVGSKISCDNVRCGYGASCAIKNGRPTCKCPSLICVQIYEPICGTDGVTYPNSCSLKSATCKSNGSITKAKDGECLKTKNSDEFDLISSASTSDSKGASSNKDDQTDNDYDTNKDNDKDDDDDDDVKPSKSDKLSKDDDQDSADSEDESVSRKGCKKSSSPVPTEDVPSEQAQSCSVRPCTKIFQPVCGSNGLTYNNICILNNASCKSQSKIFKIKDGPCNSNGATKSRSSATNSGFAAKCRLICQRSRAPQCSQAQLEQGQTNSCLTPQSIQFVKQCQCNFSSTPSLPTIGSSPNCPQVCPLFFKPICGSNGHTYGNECELQRASCQMQIPIFKVHDGNCRSITNPGGPIQVANTQRNSAGSNVDTDY